MKRMVLVNGLELEMKLEALRALVELEQTAEQRRRFPGSRSDVGARVKVREKYALIDVSHCHQFSGKYMVEMTTGRIFGIKGYGRIHRGHQYGTLDTINEWNWGGYVAVPKRQPSTPMEA